LDWDQELTDLLQKQRYEQFDRRNRVKCNQHSKISPWFGDGEEAAMKQAGGLGRRKQIWRGRRPMLGEDKAASTIGPRLGKHHQPATSLVSRKKLTTSSSTPTPAKTEEEWPSRATRGPSMTPLPPRTVGRGKTREPHQGDWRAGGSEERRGEDEK
jgi:hypothetical protein